MYSSTFCIFICTHLQWLTFIPKLKIVYGSSVGKLILTCMFGQCVESREPRRNIGTQGKAPHRQQSKCRIKPRLLQPSGGNTTHYTTMLSVSNTEDTNLFMFNKTKTFPDQELRSLSLWNFSSFIRVFLVSSHLTSLGLAPDPLQP